MVGEDAVKSAAWIAIVQQKAMKFVGQVAPTVPTQPRYDFYYAIIYH